MNKNELCVFYSRDLEKEADRENRNAEDLKMQTFGKVLPQSEKMWYSMNGCIINSNWNIQRINMMMLHYTYLKNFLAAGEGNLLG